MEPVGDLLKRYLESRNLRSEHGYPALFRGWGTVIHGHLAQHSRVVDVKNRVLIVEVDHPGWRQIILMQKDDILRKIHHLFPELEINDIKTILFNDNRLYRKPEADFATAEGKNRAEEDPGKSEKGTETYKENVAATKDEKFRSTLHDLYMQIVERSRNPKSG